MSSAKVIFFSILVLCVGTKLHAHGGALNQDGCHNSFKNGEYHCHRDGYRPATSSLDVGSPEVRLTPIPNDFGIIFRWDRHKDARSLDLSAEIFGVPIEVLEIDKSFRVKLYPSSIVSVSHQLRQTRPPHRCSQLFTVQFPIAEEGRMNHLYPAGRATMLAPIGSEFHALWTRARDVYIEYVNLSTKKTYSPANSRSKIDSRLQFGDR
jgi:hypothetical protein